ncbi:MAG TPA: hypothetical protein VFV23_10390 [Verrucomicrobiae bacterium]|nr:hypothetical protein [Verrucomicrobiae bacterium]
MKKLIIILFAIVCANASVFAEDTASLGAKLVEQAKASGDSQLGSLGSLLTDKAKSFAGSLAGNSAVKGKVDDVLKSLLGDKDSAALNSALQLAGAAKLTPQQTDLAKQVGNVASAYVVQKNFSKLEGAQGDVSSLVNSLRDGKLTSAVTPLKNIAQNNHLTDGQKQLVKTLMDKYAPGLNKIGGVKKLF